MAEICIIKIGGRPLADPESLKVLCRELEKISRETPVAVIHGGGSEVSRISRIFGLEPVFVDGLRSTSEEEMAVVEMVLAGRMNTLLVRSLAVRGMRAVGLSGCDAGMLIAEAAAPRSRTGRIVRTDGTLITDLIQGGYMPVCSSVAMDSSGEALNINADEAALEIAAGVNAARLVYLSDVPGILLDKQVIPVIGPEEAEKKITSGEIAGGMIPKVRSSFRGLSRGIGEIIIGGCDKEGDLQALLQGSGTHLRLH
ncbi:acetylglutamate kinase [Marispirochaeta aestuarii]|uniref:acetylglutamate kinase n=1 Tax=Marispirochaeta aestuarii TaxID=1963862 RepID=UPI0029C757C3|nr:acetylglutamate kinase [Marispirochaeta aestuarii]